jgi:hypothetical protein
MHALLYNANPREYAAGARQIIKTATSDVRIAEKEKYYKAGYKKRLPISHIPQIEVSAMKIWYM